MDVKVTSKAAWINVNDIYGHGTAVSFQPNSTIEKLKETVLKELSMDDEDNGIRHKLVLVNDKPRSLIDSCTARDERLENGDSVLIVKVISNKAPPISSRSNQTFDPPPAAIIQQATENVPLQSSSPKSSSAHSNDSSSTQVEQTLRKVLLALLELSYKFMHFETGGSTGPNTDTEVANEAETEIETNLIKNLVDMGFEEKLAKKALHMNNMDKTLAMEWLLNHSSDNQNDDTPSASTSQGQSASSNQQPFYKYRSRTRQFKPNPNHLENLLAMGFAKEESIQALRISGNNPNTACDWLLSDRTVQTDVDQPLSSDSELYKALLANPTIHIGLHDPKVVEALEDMVENPWRRNNWAYESAVGNVILQILKLYNKFSMTSTQG